MSIGPMPPAGNVSGASLAQHRASETDQAKEADDQRRTERNDQRSAQAEGIGQTEEDAEAEDRDADGRQPWQRRRGSAEPESTESDSATETPRSRDPEGARGNQLDLSG